MRRFLQLVLLALLAAAPGACAPYVQQVAAIDRAATLQPDTAIMADGTSLPYRVWRAKSSRAVIVAVHGFNDYSNTFAAPGAWLAKRGITTYAYDQRGFGRTKNRGLWAGRKNLTSDLRSFTALVRARHPGKPVYLMGVSMGGAVVMTALAEGAVAGVEGAVLLAPAVWGWQALNPVYKTGLWVAAHTVPSTTATGRGLGKRPSDNTEMLRALGRDRLVIKETRMDAIYGLVNLMDAAYAAPAKIDTPLLVLYGEKDEIVPKEPTYDVIARLGGPRRVVVYENGWHMLLRGLDARTVYGDIVAWISDRKAPLPSGEEVADPAKLAETHPHTGKGGTKEGVTSR